MDSGKVPGSIGISIGRRCIFTTLDTIMTIWGKRYVGYRVRRRIWVRCYEGASLAKRSFTAFTLSLKDCFLSILFKSRRLLVHSCRFLFIMNP